MTSLRIINGTRGIVGSLLCFAMSYYFTWTHDALAAAVMFVASCTFYKLAIRRDERTGASHE